MSSDVDKQRDRRDASRQKVLTWLKRRRNHKRNVNALKRQLQRCYPRFRDAVQTYMQNKTVQHMLRFFKLLEEYCIEKRGTRKYAHHGDMKYVGPVLEASHINSDNFAYIITEGAYCDSEYHINRIRELWQMLDEIGRVLQ